MNLKIISGTKDEIDKETFNEMIKLRYKIYLETGFIKKNDLKTYSDRFDENDTIHFIAKDKDKVIGSISLMINELPLEEIYKDEKNELIKKTRSKKIVEISRFVIDKDYRIKDKDVKDVKDYDKYIAFRFYKKIYFYLIKKRIKLVMITVHPKYEQRYIKHYNFRTYGELKYYPKVDNNPAILMYQTRAMLYGLFLRNIKTFIFFIKK